MKNVIGPDALFEKSNLRKCLPKKFSTAKKLWEDVKDKIALYCLNLAADGTELEEIDDLFEDLSYENVDEIFVKGCWAWVPSGKSSTFKKCGRLGQHFKGPMYTCKGYEWPEYEGCIYYPLVQIDLEKASVLAGVNLGNGFFQLFQTPTYDCCEGYFFRIIPRSEISSEKITPLPELKEISAKDFDEYYFEDPCELFEESGHAFVVDSFDNKIMSMPSDMSSFEELIGSYCQIWCLRKTSSSDVPVGFAFS
jgi:hypothetical protein